MSLESPASEQHLCLAISCMTFCNLLTVYLPAYNFKLQLQHRLVDSRKEKRLIIKMVFIYQITIKTITNKGENGLTFRWLCDDVV